MSSMVSMSLSNGIRARFEDQKKASQDLQARIERLVSFDRSEMKNAHMMKVKLAEIKENINQNLQTQNSEHRRNADEQRQEILDHHQVVQIINDRFVRMEILLAQLSKGKMEQAETAMVSPMTPVSSLRVVEEGILPIPIIPTLSRFNPNPSQQTHANMRKKLETHFSNQSHNLPPIQAHSHYIPTNRLEYFQSAFDCAIRTQGYDCHYQGHRDAILVCNGFKESENTSLALLRRKLELNTVNVIEQEVVLDLVINVNLKMNVRLQAELRNKHSSHSGSTTGEKGKFGLRTIQIVGAVKKLSLVTVAVQPYSELDDRLNGIKSDELVTDPTTPPETSFNPFQETSTFSDVAVEKPLEDSGKCGYGEMIEAQIENSPWLLYFGYKDQSLIDFITYAGSGDFSYDDDVGCISVVSPMGYDSLWDYSNFWDEEKIFEYEIISLDSNGEEEEVGTDPREDDNDSVEDEDVDFDSSYYIEESTDSSYVDSADSDFVCSEDEETCARDIAKGRKRHSEKVYYHEKTKIFCKENNLNEIEEMNLSKFMGMKLEEPVENKRKVEPNSYKMTPFVHASVARISMEMNFFPIYDKDKPEKKPTMKMSGLYKMCLMEGSSSQPEAKANKMEVVDKIETMFNVSERFTETEGRRFFEELDRDGDGKVTWEDLEIAMMRRRLPKRYVKDFMRRTRSHLFSKLFGWKLFLSLMEQKKSTILCAYTSLCLTKSGTLQKSEILASPNNAELPANEDNANVMMRILKADTKKSISYEHFRNFMVLLPYELLHDDPRNIWFEAVSVTNAILDGSEEILLVAETIRRLYPVETISTVRRICAETEKVYNQDLYFKKIVNNEHSSGNYDANVRYPKIHLEDKVSSKGDGIDMIERFGMQGAFANNKGRSKQNESKVRSG